MPRIEDLQEYTVVDNQGNELGQVNHMWVDEATGRLELLGIDCGMGKTCIAPAVDSELNEDARELRVNYSEDRIRDAPDVDAEDVLDEDAENRLFNHYGLERSTAESPTGLPAPGVAPKIAPAQEERAREAPERERGEMEHPEAMEEGAEIPLAEEKLHVGKREVPTGGVRLRKVVRSRPVTEELELRREEVEIEREPARGQELSESAFQEQEFFIPTSREEAVVEKRPVITGVVEAHKKVETEPREIREEVRREEIEREPTREMPGRQEPEDRWKS